MKPVQKILVPTDFSECAAEALQFAIDFARCYQAGVDLIYVYEPLTYVLPEGYAIPNAEQLDLLIAEGEKLLEKAADQVRSAGITPVKAMLRRGRASDEIISLAKERGTDLIVMGTHGRTGLKHLLLGSVAEHVVRRAHCPVLTVRQRAA